MTKPLNASLLAVGLLALCALPASAHVTYTGRDFGTFQADGLDVPLSLSISNLSSNFGWADATDADFGDTHRTRAFRFTLANSGQITLTVQGASISGSEVLDFPAFSLYAGLAHLPPGELAHDGTAITQTYLNSLGGVPKEGALVALGDWMIGNDPVYNTPGDPGSGVAVPATLKSLTYIGHAADGTSANYGSAPGITGDGLADGFIAGTFDLPAGDYTVMIGGANYSTQGPVTLGVNSTNGSSYTAYGLTATLAVVPEPSSTLLLASSALGLLAPRCRR